MKRKVHSAPRRGTIPLWKIRRAVHKVLHDPKCSKSAMTKQGLSLTSRVEAA